MKCLGSLKKVWLLLITRNNTEKLIIEVITKHFTVSSFKKVYIWPYFCFISFIFKKRAFVYLLSFYAVFINIKWINMKFNLTINSPKEKIGDTIDSTSISKYLTLTSIIHFYCLKLLFLLILYLIFEKLKNKRVNSF